MHRLVIALVTLLALTGAGVVAAYLFLFAAGTDRAARLAPADTAVYVNVYLQPSTGQQMNLAELIGRLPGFADDATLDDKVDQIVQNLLADAGIDYRAAIKPWLGNQVALAARADELDAAEPEPVVIAEVKDLDAARASIDGLVTADGGTPVATEPYEGIDVVVSADAAHAFIDDMLVVGPDAAAVQRVIDVSRGADALADREDFRRTMAEMPVDHLAAAFVDLAAIARAADAEQQLDEVSTAGAVLVAEEDGLRLSGSAPVTADPAATPPPSPVIGDRPSVLPAWMPDDTIAEVVVFGLRQALEDAEAAAAGTPEGEELLGALDAFRAIAAFALGIDVDADVLPLLDREVGVAFAGFEEGLPSGQLLLRPADPEAAADGLATITERLSSIAGEPITETVGAVTITVLAVPDIGEVAWAAAGEVIIIGLGRDDVVAALEAHDAGTSLAEREAYRRTFAIAGTRAGSEAWLDVAALVELMDPPELDDDARDILGQIGAFGFTAPSRDDEIEFHAVLTVIETRPD